MTDSQEFSEMLLAAARSAFEEDGELSPMIALLSTRDPRGFELEKPAVCALQGGCIDFSTEQRRLHAVEFARDIIRRTGAVAVGVISESSTAYVGREPSEPPPVLSFEQIEGHPTSQSSVMVTLEFKGEDPKTWIAKVTRTGSKVSLGPFQQVEHEMRFASGACSSLHRLLRDCLD